MNTEVKPLSKFAQDHFVATILESYNTRIELTEDGELIFLEEKGQKIKDSILSFYTELLKVNFN